MQMRLYGTVEKVSEVRRMGWVISFLGRPGRTMHNGRVKVIAMARKQVVLVMVEMVELVLIRIPILILMLSAVLVVLLLGLPHTKVAGGASDSA